MSPPFMPLHIGDYRRDTGHLRAAGHGAYLLLIMHYWTTGGLPDDDEQLASIACMNDDEWRKWRPILERFFKPGWKHERIESGLKSAADAHKRRVSAGRKGGKQCSSNAAAMLKQPITYNLEPIKEERKKDPAPKRGQASKTYIGEWRPSNSLSAKGQEEFEKMKDWALSNGIRKVDWAATWRNWMKRAGGGCELTEANLNPDIGFYAQFGSPEQEAWDAYGRRTKGLNYPRDKKGGWVFPSRWPPDAQFIA